MPTKPCSATAEEPCNVPSVVYSGRALATYSENSGCLHPLKLTDQTGPAIPIQLTGNKVVLADGSINHPIQLTKLQVLNIPAVNNVLTKLSDGTIGAWNIAQFSGKKRLLVENGSLHLEDDVLPDLLSSTICEGGCNDVSHVLGAKLVTIDCPGAPSIQLYQLCLIPKCCCQEGGGEALPDGVFATLNPPA